ncbi:MAG: 30S ribosomal protein S20 [Candidatus Cybelea sp.]
MILAVPNIKAAEKWVLQSEKRATRNKGVKSRLRTLFKRAADSGDIASAPKVESAFDKAASKGIIHPNKAARKKARLAKAVRRTTAAPAKPAKGRSTKKKT